MVERGVLGDPHICSQSQYLKQGKTGMSRERDKMRRSREAGLYSAPVKCTRKPRVGWERDGLRVDK